MRTRITRRSFVQVAAAGIAGLVSLGKAESLPEMESKEQEEMSDGKSLKELFGESQEIIRVKQYGRTREDVFFNQTGDVGGPTGNEVRRFYLHVPNPGMSGIVKKV